MGRQRRKQPKKLARKLRLIRRDLGLTQQQLAEHVKVDSGAVSRYERGIREPSLLELLAYSRMAGVSMETLVDDKLDLPK